MWSKELRLDNVWTAFYEVTRMLEDNVIKCQDVD